jgi:hypothetical protein
MALRHERLVRRCCVVVAHVTLIGWAVSAQATTAEVKDQWETLNAQALEAYQAGDFAKETSLAEKALELARLTFGGRDPATLTSLNNLAEAYQDQGRRSNVITHPLFRRGNQDENRD